MGQKNIWEKKIPAFEGICSVIHCTVQKPTKKGQLRKIRKSMRTIAENMRISLICSSIQGSYGLLRRKKKLDKNTIVFLRSKE
jgi:O-succinylbenzoate synthase